MNINMTDKIGKKEATFAVPYNGEDNNDYVDGKGFCCNDGSLEAAQARAMTRAAKNNFQEGDSYEKMQFYYHPDHLGSSSYITNLDGEVVQHIEYVPFSEIFIEERNNIWNTPYLFNAKEFDEETGMYYYGARYYESRLSLWMSVDRFAENIRHLLIVLLLTTLYATMMKEAIQLFFMRHVFQWIIKKSNLHYPWQLILSLL